MSSAHGVGGGPDCGTHQREAGALEALRDERIELPITRPERRLEFSEISGGGRWWRLFEHDAPDGAPPSGNANLRSTQSRNDGVERSTLVHMHMLMRCSCSSKYVLMLPLQLPLLPLLPRCCA